MMLPDPSLELPAVLERLAAAEERLAMLEAAMALRPVCRLCNGTGMQSRIVNEQCFEAGPCPNGCRPVYEWEA